MAKCVMEGMKELGSIFLSTMSRLLRSTCAWSLSKESTCSETQASASMPSWVTRAYLFDDAVRLGEHELVVFDEGFQEEVADFRVLGEHLRLELVEVVGVVGLPRLED